MLTRLRVSGFKNLVDVDIYFGPFTCIAGANGSGKSNLFDALRFLGALANNTLMDAALSVRDDGGHSGDVQSLFHHVADWYAPRMTFEADMIVPREVTDDLGKKTKAASTYLRYGLELSFTPGPGLNPLRIEREELQPLDTAEDSSALHFPHKPAWSESVIAGKRRNALIATRRQDDGTTIVLHGESGRQKRPQEWLAADLPRSVLSSQNTSDNPTLLAVKRELQSWQVLQLEPSALRRPDGFSASTRLAANGMHLPSTLYRLAQAPPGNGEVGSIDEHAARVYAQVANRLSGLIEGIREIYIDRDPQRELLTLYAAAKDGTAYPARALSDGTLRFLALAVMELDPEISGVLCLEEPENGIHPSHIPEMVKLLLDIPCDTQWPVDRDNPLRQVIINTHSPSVVAEVPEGSLVLARLTERVTNGRRYKSPQFCALSDTWRAESRLAPVVSKGELLEYLQRFHRYDDTEIDAKTDNEERRVADREDMQSLLFPSWK